MSQLTQRWTTLSEYGNDYDVVVTSKRRNFDVITSTWRLFDVITTSYSNTYLCSVCVTTVVLRIQFSAFNHEEWSIWFMLQSRLQAINMVVFFFPMLHIANEYWLNEYQWESLENMKGEIRFTLHLKIGWKLQLIIRWKLHMAKNWKLIEHCCSCDLVENCSWKFVESYTWPAVGH